MERLITTTLISAAVLGWGSEARAQTVETYAYDALGQVTSAVRQTGSDTSSTAYAYDKAGNRTQVTATTNVATTTAAAAVEPASTQGPAPRMAAGAAPTALTPPGAGPAAAAGG